MDMSPREYQDYVKNLQKKSPLLKDMALAFAIGGAICVIGQLILNGWLMLLPQDDAATATSVSLVFLSALFTGLNLYNKLARFGGAGTLVPITGFANAVASPAIDFRAEGLVAVLGLYPDGCRKGGQSSRSCFCLRTRTRARMPP